MSAQIIEKPLRPGYWTVPDIQQLLAYVNWCGRHDINCLATVAEYLKNITSQEFTQKQIERKLKWIYTKYGLPEATFEQFLRHGTIQINPFDEEDAALASIVDQIGEPEWRHRLRRASSRSAGRGKGRSAAASVRNTPSGSGERDQSHRPRSALRLTSIDQENRKNLDIYDEFADDVADEWMGKNEYATGQPQHPTRSGTQRKTALGYPRSGITETESCDVRPDTRHRKLAQAWRQSPEENLEILREEVQKQKARCFNLQCRLSDAEDELQGLQRVWQSRDVDAFELRVNNYYLNEQVVRGNVWTGYFKEFEADELGLSRSDARSEYAALFHDINNVGMAIHDVGSDTGQVERQTQNSTQDWLYKFSGWSLERLLASGSIAYMSRHELITYVLAAGVFQLVLRPAFTEILTLESPIIRHYRKQVLNSGGREALCRFDRCALKALSIETQFTERVIPQRADSLTEFILQALWFLFPSRSGNVAQPSPQTEEETVVVNGLNNTLRRALQLKTNLTLFATTVKFHFFGQGDNFDGRSMQFIQQSVQPYTAYDGSAVRVAGGSKRQQPVKLCIMPALYSSPSVQLGAASEDVYQYSNLSFSNSVGEASAQDLVGLKLVAKAVVG